MTSTRLRNVLMQCTSVLMFATFVAAAVCSTSGAYAAGETKPSPVAAKPPGGQISQEQATQAALQALPGKVTDVTIEKKRGKNVYVIEVVADKDGEETDVLVDMDSGVVLGMEH